MMKRILPVAILILALTGCAAAPAKHSSRKFAACDGIGATSLKGVPYAKLSQTSCAVALAPFDLGVWLEAPYNSHKIRGLKAADLGCAPLSPGADDCDYSGVQGRSGTLIMNFDASVYPEGAAARRAVLAVYALKNPAGLYEAQVRGRLNIGDELQSLAAKREFFMEKNKDQGWVFYDVTAFAARAINERRNSVQFEISLPCQTQGANPVTAGVLNHEPRLVVEFD